MKIQNQLVDKLNVSSLPNSVNNNFHTSSFHDIIDEITLHSNKVGSDNELLHSSINDKKNEKININLLYKSNDKIDELFEQGKNKQQFNFFDKNNRIEEVPLSINPESELHNEQDIFEKSDLYTESNLNVINDQFSDLQSLHLSKINLDKIQSNSDTNNVFNEIQSNSDTNNMSDEIQSNSDTNNMSDEIQSNSDTNNVFDEIQYNSDTNNIFDEIQYNSDTNNISDEMQFNSDINDVLDEIQSNSDTNNVFDEIQYNSDTSNIFNEIQSNSDMNDISNKKYFRNFSDLHSNSVKCSDSVVAKSIEIKDSQPNLEKNNSIEIIKAENIENKFKSISKNFNICNENMQYKNNYNAQTGYSSNFFLKHKDIVIQSAQNFEEKNLSYKENKNLEDEIKNINDQCIIFTKENENIDCNFKFQHKPNNFIFDKNIFDKFYNKQSKSFNFDIYPGKDEIVQVKVKLIKNESNEIAISSNVKSNLDMMVKNLNDLKHLLEDIGFNNLKLDFYHSDSKNSNKNNSICVKNYNNYSNIEEVVNHINDTINSGILNIMV